MIALGSVVLLAGSGLAGAQVLEAATAPLPACGFGEVLTPWPRLDQVRVTILDTWYRLPSTYVPPLRSVTAAGFSSGGSVRRDVIPDLAALRAAAHRAGVPLGIRSAYRSYATQAWTYRLWVRILGRSLALRSSARAGHSEHQLGTAIDFTVPGGSAPWSYRDWASQTRTGAWLKANAWRFGFVMSYPRGMSSRTCYDYEPWHYRWVGREIAAKIRASGLPPRAWMRRFGETYANPTPTPGPTPEPTPAPTPEPTPAPTPEPTPAPTPEPTPAP